jgi:hypothetical protein
LQLPGVRVRVRVRARARARVRVATAQQGSSNLRAETRIDALKAVVFTAAGLQATCVGLARVEVYPTTQAIPDTSPTTCINSVCVLSLYIMIMAIMALTVGVVNQNGF